jgi:septal ring factor EnvC (AmiA/AmiB activator)
MADQEKKEGIFKKAVDALSSKDENETIASLEAELEQAKKDAEAAKTAINDLLKQNAEAKKGSSSADMKAKAAEKRIAELEAKLKELTVKDKQVGGSKAGALKEKLDKPAIITVHTVESNNQTLSHVALKYYKHATPPYWKYLLEHNTEVLKGSEKNIRMGMKLEIPELPEELKD